MAVLGVHVSFRECKSTDSSTLKLPKVVDLPLTLSEPGRTSDLFPVNR